MLCARPCYHARLPTRASPSPQYRPLRLMCGTWNVNGKFPREDLTPWLADGAYDLGQGGPGGQGGARINMPDVYVIG